MQISPLRPKKGHVASPLRLVSCRSIRSFAEEKQVGVVEDAKLR